MIDHGLGHPAGAGHARASYPARFGLLEARDTLHIEGRFPAKTHRRAWRGAVTRSTAGATGTKMAGHRQMATHRSMP